MTTNSNEEDWSHMRETILMINVAVARIEVAMLEGNESFTSISDSFINIAHSADKITQEMQNRESASTNDAVIQSCKDINAQVHNSVVSFQFYDRLSQRMASVSQTLNSLTEILNHPQKAHTQTEWAELQNVIRSKYTLDADQEMFDAVLNGVSIQDALRNALIQTKEDEIEFF